MFWFTPEPTYALGLIRIAFGMLTVAWTLSLLDDLHTMFGERGVLPRQPQNAYQWGLFAVWPSDGALWIGWGLLLGSALALTVGWHSRLAAVIVFVLILSFQQRNSFVFNSGDNLIRIEALFLALFPSGAALSLDRRRSAGSFWSAEIRPRWPVRLMQVQLSLIYLSTVRVKLDGNTWHDGTAVSYALRLRDMVILPTPQWFSTNELLMNVTTWGTLAVELALGVLVWNRWLRPWVLAAGVAMHTAIMIGIGVGFFTPAMFVLYLAFLSPETVRKLPDTFRRRIEHEVDTIAAPKTQRLKQTAP